MDYYILNSVWHLPCLLLPLMTLSGYSFVFSDGHLVWGDRRLGSGQTPAVWAPQSGRAHRQTLAHRGTRGPHNSGGCHRKRLSCKQVSSVITPDLRWPVIGRQCVGGRRIHVVRDQPAVQRSLSIWPPRPQSDSGPVRCLHKLASSIEVTWNRNLLCISGESFVLKRNLQLEYFLCSFFSLSMYGHQPGGQFLWLHSKKE